MCVCTQQYRNREVEYGSLGNPAYPGKSLEALALRERTLGREVASLWCTLHLKYIITTRECFRNMFTENEKNISRLLVYGFAQPRRSETGLRRLFLYIDQLFLCRKQMLLQNSFVSSFAITTEFSFMTASATPAATDLTIPTAYLHYLYVYSRIHRSKCSTQNTRGRRINEL